jgi:hypothetical protein
MASVLSLSQPPLGLASVVSATPKNSHSRLSAIATIDFESLLPTQNSSGLHHNHPPRLQIFSSFAGRIHLRPHTQIQYNSAHKNLNTHTIPSRWLASVPKCRITPPIFSPRMLMNAQYQLGNHPRDDASLQEDSYGRSQCPHVDSNRLPRVELDHHWYLRLHALLDQ